MHRGSGARSDTHTDREHTTSVLLRSILLSATSTLLYSRHLLDYNTLHCVLLYSIYIPLGSVVFYYIVLCSIPFFFYSILQNCIRLQSFFFYSTLFYSTTCDYNLSY